eukprot:8512226-Alexandrium_andersonii.AAC.1
MSASLVGSEMCIRDRFIPGQAGTPIGRWCAPNPPAAAGALQPGMAGTWTVSYTHLTLPTICSV